MALLNYANLVDPLLRGLRRLTVAYAGMWPGDRALDVCCGTGAQVRECARRGMEAHGVDLDPGMLRLGGGAPSLPGPGSVSFYRGDAAQLPFPDGVFDFVTVSLALHDKSRAERGRVVEEMRRVAKPGATLVFTDFQVPLPRNPVALAARVIEFCAGGDHYAGFRDYLKSGDLDGFIHSRGLRPLRSRTAVGGLLVMIAARPEETA